MGMKPRAFAGAVNNAKEVLVPVSFAEHEEAILWLPLAKTVAKEIVDEARALADKTGEEIEIDAELDGETLYIDPTFGGTLTEGEGPGEEEEEEEEEEPKEEPEEEPAES